MQSLTVDITTTPCFGQIFCTAYAHFFSLPKEVGRIKNSLFSLYLFLSVNDSRLSIQQVREIRESAISKTVTSKAASFKTAKKTFKLLRKGREDLQLIATFQQKKSELPEWEETGLAKQLLPLERWNWRTAAVTGVHPEPDRLGTDSGP